MCGFSFGICRGNHFVQQVQPNGVFYIGFESQFYSDVTCTTRNVYCHAILALRRQLCSLLFPATMHTESHQVVHKVIPTGYSREEIGDIALFLGALKFSHGTVLIHHLGPDTSSRLVGLGPNQELQIHGLPQNLLCR